MDSHLLRMSDVRVSVEGRWVLNGLSLTLHHGEILAVFGTFDTGKRVIMDVIEGRRAPTSGHLFFEGKIVAPGTPPCKIVRISKTSSVLDSLTVWENLFLVRRRQFPLSFTDPKKDRQMARVVMEDYAFSLDPNRKGSELTDAEKLAVELLRARMERARLVLIDEFSIHASPEERKMLKALMDRMAEDGMTFLLAGYRLELLEAFAERLLFLSHGHIMYSVRVDAADPETVRRVTEAMFPIAPYEGGPGASPGQRMWELHLGGAYDLSFERGRVQYYLDPYSDLIRAIRAYFGQMGNDTGFFTIYERNARRGRRGTGIRVAVMDYDIVNMIFREMSAVENICIGLPERFSVRGLMSAGTLQFVEREFADWLGDSSLAKRGDCEWTTRRERIAISLYRLKMFKPDVLISLNLITELDLITERLLKDTWAELAAEGTSICGVTSDWEKVLPVADEYALVMGDQVSRAISFADIRQLVRLMWET